MAEQISDAKIKATEKEHSESFDSIFVNDGDKVRQVTKEKARELMGVTGAETAIDKLNTDLASAVSEIQKNTEADEETKRKLDFLYKLNQGISYQYETDSASAYQKDIPSGAKCATVNKIGGKTVVWGQLIPACNVKGNSNFTVSDTFKKIYAGHKYYMSFKYSGNPSESGDVSAFVNVNGASTISMRAPYSTPEVIVTAKYDGYPWIYFYPIDADVVTYDLQVVDITLLEQSLGITIDTVSDYKSLFPKDYYDTCPLTLLSAHVNEVVEQGKNLFILSQKNNNGITFGVKDSKYVLSGTSTALATNRGEVTHLESGNYTLSGIVISSGQGIYLRVRDSSLSLVASITFDGATSKSLNFTISKDGDYYIEINVASGITLNDYTVMAQLEKSSSATSYSPYHKTTYQIPVAITQLDGYGWGITDDVCNYVDWENRTFHKRVGIRDFAEGDSDDSTVLTNGANTLYELAEEVITDISDIIGDTFQDPFEVEPGGTLTFKNSNSDDYRIPVQSEEEYLISLAEVTA